MDVKTDIFDFNSIAQKEWSLPEKGLKKELVSFEYKSMKKSTELSKCLIKISNVKNLDLHESNYLSKLKDNAENWIQISEATTPIDYYIELFIEQMYENETSQCFIKTNRNSNEITFYLTLINIIDVKYLFQLNLKEMYLYSLKLKENGVLMFKKYPKFAHEYFCRAAKCLISYKPFDNLTEESDGVEGIELSKLLKVIQLNIAACLIKFNSYENILYLTQFLIDENNLNNSNGELDKAIYRRSLALYNLKKFYDAKELIEKFNCKNKKEFSQLYQKIVSAWKHEHDNYKNVIKKMFN